MEVGKIKLEIVEKIKKLVAIQIDSTRAEITSLESSRNADTKSSAGDKHETSRAMVQTEIDNHHSQLMRHLRLQNEIEQAVIPVNSEIAQFGSMLFTDNGHFFIFYGMGRIQCAGVEWITLSPASPLGIALMGGQRGDTVQFRNDAYHIMRLG